jgi:hypothetical protein
LTRESAASGPAPSVTWPSAPRSCGREQAPRFVGVEEDRLGHRVEERRRERGQLRPRERLADVDAPGLAALDTVHRAEAADMRDVGRLRGPGRDRSRPRHDEERLAGRLRRRLVIDVEQPLEERVLGGLEVPLRVDEVDEFGVDGPDCGHRAAEPREQSLDPEAGKCGRAPEPQHLVSGHSVSASRPGRRRPDTG